MVLLARKRIAKCVRWWRMCGAWRSESAAPASHKPFFVGLSVSNMTTTSLLGLRGEMILTRVVDSQRTRTNEWIYASQAVFTTPATRRNYWKRLHRCCIRTSTNRMDHTTSPLTEKWTTIIVNEKMLFIFIIDRQHSMGLRSKPRESVRAACITKYLVVVFGPVCAQIQMYLRRTDAALWTRP